MSSELKPAPSLLQRCRRLLREEIWHHSVIAERSWRGRYYALLRMASITVKGIVKNNIFSQAGAMAYSSLMSLGPIVTLAIIISSFVLQKNSDQVAANIIDRMVSFIAPPTVEFNDTSAETPAATSPMDGTPQTGTDGQPDSTPTPAATTPGARPRRAGEVTVDKSFIVRLINKLVVAAKSKTVGVAGLLLLVFICIQLIISIENTFNRIWGVRRGRGWIHRVVIYWLVFCLGVLGVFTAGASTWGGLMKYLPWGLDALSKVRILPDLLSFILLAGMLALFYRYIPNTLVRWGPALMGGAIVSFCLLLNNYLSFVYVRQVTSAKSLFGSVGIILMLIFGLYVFWLMILLGGQLTFSVQNANNITDDRLWEKISPRTRRLLGLAAFVQIARAFVRQAPGPTSEELAKALRAPLDLLNESLTRLGDLKLINPVESSGKAGDAQTRYQPSRPLDKISLGEVHHDLDIFGNDSADETIEVTDHVLPKYLDALACFEKGPELHRTFAEILADEKPA